VGDADREILHALILAPLKPKSMKHNDLQIAHKPKLRAFCITKVSHLHDTTRQFFERSGESLKLSAFNRLEKKFRHIAKSTN